MPAGHVHRGGDGDVGYLLRAVRIDDALQLGKVHVALECEVVLRVVRLVHDDVHECAARQFLVELGGGEVHVAGHDVAGLDEDLREDVLRTAPLVGGHEVRVAVELLHRLLQVVVVAAAGVSLVAQHQPGPLAVAHGAGAAVGEQVDVDQLGGQKEGVVAGFFDGLHTLFTRGHEEGFDHLDLEGLGPGCLAHVDRRCSVVIRPRVGHRAGAARAPPRPAAPARPGTARHPLPHRRRRSAPHRHSAGCLPAGCPGRW